ncbi:hypothetical protein GBAR_LOCUS614 [Geodia barretti]|uniref:Uncharacterized protein n=1 Tax=Geodia barretti TaxID=519541 RepID=A0AA35VT32_GEOBA|nr:hypothetical protein GBAR_LOCUS614 [Geodia barretti]
MFSLMDKSTRSERHHLLTSEEVHRKRPKGSDIPSKDYDSLDYDNCYNVPYKKALRTFSKKVYLLEQICPKSTHCQPSLHMYIG